MQNTNLNVSPYFDDFDENKNYNKVLFKPGFPIQSRELTTLQSILQNQIEKFGQHFFKEGAVVIPGGIFFDNTYYAVRVDPSFLNIPVREYLGVLSSNKLEIQGETSGVKATVVNYVTSDQSEDGFDTLYVKYTNSGSDGSTRSFQNGENLITLSNIDYSLASIEANSLFARCVVDNATDIGSSASINEGVYFIRGNFVKVESSTVILDQYSPRPSYRVGLLIREDIISASSENPDLYDNAKGFSNESAPGADRLSITARLFKKSLSDLDDRNFVELLRVENGEVQTFVNKTNYNIFKDELARRTYDESGDYYTKPFAIDVRESLNDRIANRGVYFENQVTQNGNTPSDNIFVLQVSPGKAYVRGNEIDKISTSTIDIVKPRTTKLEENISLPINVGNIVKVDNIYGSPNIGFTASNTVSLLDRRLEDGLIGSASTIGLARVYDFAQKIASGVSTTQYEVRLLDIQTYTTLTVGFGITAPSDAHVKGQYSGSTAFLKDSVSNGTSLSLYDVKGQFQLNEPLSINGLDVGRNVTDIRDYDFTDIKALHSEVGVSTFAADLVLDKNKKLFTEASQFTITTGGTVTSPSVADFRGIVKVGDIVKYSRPTLELPSYNRVTAVTQNNLTVVGISTVVDAYDGGLVTSELTTTDFDVISSPLSEADRSGFIVPFQNNFVSSVNLLDSTYILRRQITKNITGSTFTFYLSDLGDDDLYFEPYTEANYILTWESGQKEKLFDAQVEFDANLREVTLSGLSRTGNATLTATLKRSKLSSKDKSIVRSSVLVVNRSKYNGSGIGNTTFDDGLTYSTIYGTRVQDEEISLNVPDIYRVLGVFESDDSSDPNLPSFTVSTQSSTFTNNVTIGDEVIGSDSGAVARVVSIVSGTQIEFVYENEKSFDIGEVVNFDLSGIVATISTLTVGDRNITKNYSLDTGHRLDYVDYGRITRDRNTSEPTRRVKIVFDYYSNDEASGTVESVNSYNGLNYSTEIPLTIDRRASDYVDLRPRVSEYSTASTTSPFSFTSRDFTSSSSETVVSNKTITADYSHYVGRIDRLYLTKDGIFEVKKGEPGTSPKAPVVTDEALEVALITMAPYVINATSDCAVKLIPHKRYTMKDIGGLETRIKNLENYTTLSLLETDTKNLTIKDANTGLDKFKSGFFVDNFRNHESHNLTGESYFDIDMNRGECRPRSTERNVSLIFESKSSSSNSTNADYRWIEDFESSNVTRGGSALTLAYDEVDFVSQELATRTENLNPFHIALFAGIIELTPESDHWIEEVPIETPDIVNIDSPFNAIAELLGVEDRENGGMAASFWNSHEQTWTGREFLTEERVRSRVIGRSSSTSSWTEGGGPGIRRVTRTTTRTTTSNDYLQTFRETGIDKEFGLELTPDTETVSLGSRVVGVDVLYNCRSRNIEVVGKRLKPNTRYYVFMENIDMTEYCVPKLLPITMRRGFFSTGDIVKTSISPRKKNSPQIVFRTCTSNHKFGPFDSPTDTYSTEPYSGQTLTSSYSGTSTTVNVDTGALALMLPSNENTGEKGLGWVRKGTILANIAGTAEASVSDLSLISDDQGNLIFSLHIPDPKVASNPKFTTGLNTIRITTSPTNSNILDPGESSAEAIYNSSGYAQNTQEQTLSIKTPQVERKQVGSNQPITRITQDLEENRIEVSTSSSTVRGGWYDPLAQSFLVDRNENKDGIFITGGELYFKTKDNSNPVTVQIRTMRDGSPTTTIVPFGETEILPANVNLSDDGSLATKFNFSAPVYLQSGYEYALVLVAPTEKYLTFISRMGEEDLISGSVSNKPPYLGSLFKSQNSSTWDPSQLEDLKFKLFKAKFVTNTPSSFIFYNQELSLGKILKENPVVAYSKRQYVSIANTSTAFEQGNVIAQSTNTGDIFAVGGPISLGTTSLTLGSSGIGLTDGTFTGIGFTSLTGFGNSCVATVTVSSGSVTSLNVTSAGSGYAVGDLLLANQIGNSGTGVRAIVGIVTQTNLLVLDNVNNNINTGTGLTYYNSVGTEFDLAAPSSVNNDPIRDGYTLKFDHRNHGMHSSTNKVKVTNFVTELPPTTLSADLNVTDTSISVTDGSIFSTFEGAEVGVANTGYLQIDNEIISYNSVSGNTITVASRGVDSSLISNHQLNSLVYKYEFNSVSLTKINKEHNIDSREKTFNSYYIKLDENGKTFGTTKVGGGDNLQVSQNIPFEAIDPRLNSVIPSGTNVTARVKTTTGTSLSGAEASFTDAGYEPITLNKLNYFDTPRVVASKVNEYNILGNEKSFALELTLTTNQENVSPVIDLTNSNIIAISNLVDDKVNDFELDSRTKIPGSDPNSAIYETKKISLEFASNSLYVQFDGHRSAESDIRVFYKLYRSDSEDFQQVYVPFNTDGSPDTFVNANISDNTFSDYKFTADNLPEFNAFMIKVVMTSTNQAKPPRIKNFRSIALRSS